MSDKLTKEIRSVISKNLEMLGFEPRTFRMQSERSTTELHPHLTVTYYISRISFACCVVVVLRIIQSFTIRSC